jgi:acetyl-CoA synthetase
MVGRRCAVCCVLRAVLCCAVSCCAVPNRPTRRCADVVNVSGHRIGSAEIESALVSHPCVAEAAVIGIPHDLKGQALFAYVSLKNGVTTPPQKLHTELLGVVRKEVGGFAVPDEVLLCPTLPKTRSGKIMRYVCESARVHKCKC